MLVVYLDIDKHKLTAEQLNGIDEILKTLDKINPDVRIYKRASSNGNIHYKLEIYNENKNVEMQKSFAFALRFVLLDDIGRIKLDIRRYNLIGNDKYIDWLATIKDGKKVGCWVEINDNNEWEMIKNEWRQNRKVYR